MNRGLGKMTENESQAITKLSAQLVHNRCCVLAIGAFVVAVFDQRDQSIGIATNVISFGDGEDQFSLLRIRAHEVGL